MNLIRFAYLFGDAAVLCTYAVGIAQSANELCQVGGCPVPDGALTHNFVQTRSIPSMTVVEEKGGEAKARSHTLQDVKKDVEALPEKPLPRQIAHHKNQSASTNSAASAGITLLQHGVGVLERGVLAPPSAGCGRIFIDLGANVGDTIMRFVHAEPGIFTEDGMWAMSQEQRPWNPQFPSITEDVKWPNFDYRVYDFTLMRIFNTTNSMPKDYCLVGVDANPYWKPHYAALEKYLSKQLQVHGLPRVNMQSGLAAGLDEDRVRIFCSKFLTSDLKTAHRNMMPASDQLVGDKDPALGLGDGAKRETCMVPTFDVEAYFHDMAVSTSPPTTIILKVDIEGAEVPILKRLIQSRTFCKFPQGTDIHIIAHELEHFMVDRRPAREFACGVRIYPVHPGIPCFKRGEPDSASESCFDGHGWPWALQQ